MGNIFICRDTMIGLFSIGVGFAAGITYYILLMLVFDRLLAKNDQRLLKIDKLRR